jgi:hypothetical protein
MVRARSHFIFLLCIRSLLATEPISCVSGMVLKKNPPLLSSCLREILAFCACDDKSLIWFSLIAVPLPWIVSLPVIFLDISLLSSLSHSLSFPYYVDNIACLRSFHY